MNRTAIDEFLHQTGRVVSQFLYDYLTELMEQYPEAADKHLSGLRWLLTKALWEALADGRYQRGGVMLKSSFDSSVDKRFARFAADHPDLPLNDIRKKIDSAIRGIFALHELKF